MIRLPARALGAHIETVISRQPIPLRWCELCPDEPPEVATIEVSALDVTLLVGPRHHDAAVQQAITIAVENGDSAPKVSVEITAPEVPVVRAVAA